jgi:hypothetical protein
LRETGAGQAVAKSAGGVLEVGGAAAALVGAPEVGAPLAAIGSKAKGRQGGAGRVAQQRKARRAAGRREQTTLELQGASDIRRANRSTQANPRPRPAVSPGRRTGSVDARRGADVPPF